MMKTMRERLSLTKNCDGTAPYHELEPLLDRAMLATLMMQEHMRLTASACAENPSAERRKAMDSNRADHAFLMNALKGFLVQAEKTSRPSGRLVLLRGAARTVLELQEGFADNVADEIRRGAYGERDEE